MAGLAAGKARWVVAASVILPAAVLAARPAISKYVQSPRSWPKGKFSLEVWRATRQSEGFRFYRDLDARGLLSDQPRTAVIALLGTPGFDAPYGRYLTYTIMEWCDGSWMSNALLALQINLDPAGRVTTYGITHE